MCVAPAGSPLPAPTGTYCVAGVEYHLVDTNRSESFTADPVDHREVYVRAYLPADSTAEMAQLPYPTANGDLNSVPGIAAHTVAGATVASGLGDVPVVIFSPGFGVPLELYASYAEELASHGYIVLAVGHPFYSGALRLSSGAVAQPDATVLSVTWDAIETQSRDLSFVLSHFASRPADAPWAASADWSRVVSFGHSQGATAAAEVAHDDDRVAGVVLLDGDPAADCLWSGLTKPFLVQFNSANFLDSATGIACTGVDDPTEGWHLGVLGGDSCNFYRELNRHAVAGSYYARLTSPEHMAFSDIPYLSGGTEVDLATAAASRAMTLAFANFVLRGAPSDHYAASRAEFPGIDVYAPPPARPEPLLDTVPPRACLPPGSPSPLPSPTGEYCVVGHDYHLVDGERIETLTPLNDSDHREIFVRAYVPADGMASGEQLPYPGENGALNDIPKIGTHTARGWTPPVALERAPVVLLSPDLGVSLEPYASYAEELASHGFVVLVVGNAGFSGTVHLSSGTVLAPSSPSYTKTDEAIETQRADLAFVLSHFAALPKDAPWTRVAEFDSVLAVGHGHGAGAAAELGHDEPRVRAVALLDGDPAADALREGLAAPFLALFNAHNFNDQTKGPLCSGLDDPIGPGSNGLSLDGCNSYLELIARAQPGTRLARFPSPLHRVFSDDVYVTGGTAEELRSAEASRALLLAFARVQLFGAGDDDYTPFRQGYPDVELYATAAK